MNLRVGRVTNVYPTTGKVKVVYEDMSNTSLPLSMLTMNQEYSMPSVGDRVVTIHMENGSSKGFVLGTYFGGGMQPKTNKGYRKDFGSGVFATVVGGLYKLKASKVNIIGNGASVSLDEDTVVEATSITLKAEDITLECSYGKVTVEDLLKRLERAEDSLGLPHTI